MDALASLVLFIIPLLFRLPYLLVIIPAARNFWRVTLSSDNLKYLLKTVVYLIIAAASSFLILIFYNYGTLTSTSSREYIKYGFAGWLEYHGLQGGDFQFLLCLIVFYCSALLYVFIVYLIEKMKFNYINRRAIIITFFAINLIVINGCVLYTLVPKLNYLRSIWQPSGIIIAVDIILFLMLWLFFALPAIKNLRK